MKESPSSMDGKDLIYIKSLSLKTMTGFDSWVRLKPQPVILSLYLKTSVALAGSTDHLPYSIHYGHVCKAVTRAVESSEFRTLEHLAEEVSKLALGDELHGEWVQVIVEKPRTLLRADSAGISIVRRKDGKREAEDRVFVNSLRVVTIIGIHPWERKEGQTVVLNLTLHKPINKGSCRVEQRLAFDPHYDYRKVVKVVTELVEKSTYKTVEALATAVARVACTKCEIEKVTVSIEKPSALTFAKGAGVEITRHRAFFDLIEDPSLKAQQAVGEELLSGDERASTVRHRAFVALGSNMGDRFQWIRDAVKELGRRGLKVQRTSSLYESKPMYVLEQPEFLNGVCEIETTLSPMDLLKELKDIEDTMGRKKIVEKGPRNIDLDILLYDGLVMDSDILTIPHKFMLEREFVLRPLCDIAPNLAHPLTSTSFRAHLQSLPPSTTAHHPPLRIFAPLSPASPPLDPLNPNRKTLLMAVLNLTPDSFSDGGRHSTDSDYIVSMIQSFINAGADIIDIGGQSTRPGAADVGKEEELRRVIPAIRTIREASITIPISVDTYRAEVAEQAIEAGADIINDISAGLYDENILSVAAVTGAPIVLTHTRGTPKTMNSLATYKDVISEVGEELEARMDEALAKGVSRWQIVLDPGLGFAKGMQDNLEIIRRLEVLRGREKLKGLPWLLGPSRKRFVGTITGVADPLKRGWGTAGAVAGCIAGGADIVRVHDVEEMSKVICMADSIWRNKVTA
ncbi:Dihydropteroate synthase [Terfezia boudieri ATCC MYA-4762]|uniref:Folic acid synthesis protein FOL1 n=1 Tax=Terfezia boudieri ATCC MYA-4762 TaxID=1051890 RepID=A0A3N4LT30_9PEZI|nr:Dihydropteroate synthase [Terfezia boudieri ATCC MYA-4762]